MGRWVKGGRSVNAWNVPKDEFFDLGGKMSGSNIYLDDV